MQNNDERSRDAIVTIDEDCFPQIVINLADNAVKFQRRYPQPGAEFLVPCRSCRLTLLLHCRQGIARDPQMGEGAWPVVLIVAAVIVYVVAQVVFYVRKSRQQWREVDKSKLRKWEDDEW
jgi:hypothetical protein